MPTKKRKGTRNYRNMMRKLMKTRVHRYAQRMPTIRENNLENMNNYMNYANNFEHEIEKNDYVNNFHPETEAEEYEALKKIMAQHMSVVESLAPSAAVGRMAPTPFRPVAAAAAAAGPGGGGDLGDFKPSIGSAFKKPKGGRRRKNLKTRRRK